MDKDTLLKITCKINNELYEIKACEETNMHMKDTHGNDLGFTISFDSM
jgi:hypothetical protein